MTVANPTISPAPVRRTLHVNTSATRAFDVFSREMGRWWPATHSIVKTSLKQTVIEPSVRGRWYQVRDDGTQCDVGHVIAWDPPHRLVLAWQLNQDWKYDPRLVTEVEVKFIPEGEETTRVEFEHRNLERMGEYAEITRTRIDAPAGWTAVLEAFRQCAAGGAAR